MGALRRLQSQIKDTSMIHHFFQNVRRLAHTAKGPCKNLCKGLYLPIKKCG